MFKDYKLIPEQIVYMPPVGQFDQEMLGLDIPLIVPLPRDIAPSFYSPTWDATCLHQLVVKISGGASALTELLFATTFDIPVQCFDALPLYRQFSDPIRDTHTSSDKHTVVHSTVPLTCIGPQDQLSVILHTCANSMLGQKIKAFELKDISVKLIEILESFDGGLPTHRETELASFFKEYRQGLTTEGLTEKVSLTLPYRNDWLDTFDDSYKVSEAPVTTPTASFIRFKTYTTPAVGIPALGMQSFTVMGKLFNIRHKVLVKVKVSRGRNVEFAVPITVSPFNVPSCNYLLQIIREECRLAREIFGNETVNELAYEMNQDICQRILNSYCPPPSVIRYTRTGLQELGYNPGDTDRSVSVLIDID